MSAVAWASGHRSVSHPISGIRLWLHREARDGAARGKALEAQNAGFSMNGIECESAIAAFLHLCACARGTCAHVRRRIGRRYGMPHSASRS
jgi:hypothetical protein